MLRGAPASTKDAPTLSDDAIAEPHAELFRRAMRRHAAGVCVLSVGGDPEPNGMAVTSATSFCMDPPAMLVCVNERASLAPRVGEGAPFGLTLLAADQAEVAAAFAGAPSGPPRFAHPGWRLEAGQVPWLEGAPANLACVVARRLTYGTHTAVIGRVTGVRLGPDVASLVFRDGAYG